MKVLLIEHGAVTLLPLEQQFREAGYSYEFVTGLDKASQKLGLYEYDGVLLCYDQQEEEVFEFLKRQEDNKNIGGLIIISSDTRVESKVKLLNMGADDFVSTPVHFEELDARLKAVIRRRKYQSNSKIYFANLVIEFHARSVQVWNTPVDFTRKEYEILLYLISNKDKVVSRVALAEYLWGEETDMMDSFNILSAHIKNIRRKMKQAKAEAEIKNSYGVGYQIIEL